MPKFEKKRIRYEIDMRIKTTGMWIRYECMDNEPSTEYCEQLMDTPFCKEHYSCYRILRVEKIN